MERKTNWIDLVQEEAKKRGGTCLSDTCYKAHDRVQCKCRNGHTWYSQAYNIVTSKRWCRKCALLLNGLDEAKKIAESKNGRCLASQYLGNKIHLEWECEKLHIWRATLYSVKTKKTWCPKCYDLSRSKKQRMKNGLLVAQQIAESQGGKCLESKYINTSVRMLWECSKGHKWRTSLCSVKYRNTWCQKCGYLIAAKTANRSCTLRHWRTNEEVVCVGSYEKRVVEYMNAEGIDFLWQHKTFTMGNGKTYRPDLYLVSDKKWVEIKGYFWGDARVKWEWFSVKYPDAELWDKTKLTRMGII